eukprot:snap_masked-scaffold_10-processed-gene-5.28-mRNA-1 protein AED:1.00 eAED:1.00 QI:0/0/0/0/1/1/2/0/209
MQKQDEKNLVVFNEKAESSESEENPSYSSLNLSFKTLLFLIAGISILSAAVIFSLIYIHEASDQEDKENYMEPTQKPTISPSIELTLEERCSNLRIGDTIQFSRSDYIRLIFATKVSVEQCIIFLTSAGIVSQEFNQNGNVFFNSFYGYTFFDLFDEGNATDVEIYAKGEQMVDMVIAVGIGEVDGLYGVIQEYNWIFILWYIYWIYVL